MIDRKLFGSILQVQSMLKMNLSYHDRSDQVRSIMKEKDGNDMTNCVGRVDTKNDTELF